MQKSLFFDRASRILVSSIFGTVISSSGVFAAPLNARFEYQISSNDNQLPPAAVADVWSLDGQLVSRETVQRLKRQGKRVICYINVGSWDPGKADVQNWMKLDNNNNPIPGVGRYPYQQYRIGRTTANNAIWGKRYGVEAFNEEFWWNIFHPAVKAVVDKRIENCANKGFDAVEPDNIDPYVYRENGRLVDPAGFRWTRAQIVRFNKDLAAKVRARGMKIFQKNASDLTTELTDLYDGAIVEDCLANDECIEYKPYLQRHKPVYAIEYTDSLDEDEFKNKACSPHSLAYSYVLKDRTVEPYGTEEYVRKDCRN